MHIIYAYVTLTTKMQSHNFRIVSVIFLISGLLHFDLVYFLKKISHTCTFIAWSQKWHINLCVHLFYYVYIGVFCVICVITLVFVLLLGCLCTDKTDVKNWEQLISSLGNFKCTFFINAEPRQYSFWFFLVHILIFN